MEYHLPAIGKPAIPFPHFPTRQQAFIFRAFEFIPPERIAEILGTSVQTVLRAAGDMGLPRPCDSDIWLKKGYITVIRSLWHILPYEQLLQLLDMDRASFAKLLREEDFLDHKLQDKPDCAPLTWRELTPEEQRQTQQLRQDMAGVDMTGAAPFDFSYSAPKMAFSGAPQFGTRMIYGFSSLYQTALEADSETYCPDSMLQAYGDLGINALWIPAALHDISQFPFDKTLSAGYEIRLARLQRFARRCKTFGLKLFLYLNEPRSLPDNFYADHPELRGHEVDAGRICLCTSTEEVQRYLTENVAFVCRNVPELGGIFTITRSENVTNCYSHAGRPGSTYPVCSCPRCSRRTPGEVIGEVAACYEKGVHSADPNMKVIVWSWSWGEDNLDIIAHLPPNVILQSNSEDLKPFIIGGVSGNVRDYAMSIVGPGEKAKAEWSAAKKRGLEVSAKVQINTTWECSTVPAIPVYPMIEEHMQNLRAEGVDHVMLSWTLGGYPSRNIQHAAQYFYAHCQTPPVQTDDQRRATVLFSEAFREFPFDIGVLYCGPQNGGVSNLLFTEPTGYPATMTCYAYDDLQRWRSIYPEAVFEAQLRLLCEKWEQGMALLTEDDSELWCMAKAAQIQFRACLHQVRFYRARSANDTAIMQRMAEMELDNAKQMLALMNRIPVIGFEAANHYYFSKGSIAEKIINCKAIIRKFAGQDVMR